MTLKLPQIGARELLYRPPLTSHWVWAAPGSMHDLGQDASFESRAILGWLDWSGP